ncbi:nitroreductase/quinone reductase family protein [Actinomadura rubrisoli]|uniref:Nitroreductase family deazaflavin-dependent oxidoreductase n=1 Tax=Actinomadura rubrisoli TaxID=2530368 RepID=A0A4R5ASB6_9ACTN|nr:nitroreductase/quinone reductase family protein [Actinomadura rubrisoli]TDD74586.1 nitroreductase family deazaflavin-dependent oxidoreductase [Actinomadura rubrisoli]
MNEANRPVIEEFRAGGGRVGGRFEGADLVLLTSAGAKSGRRHTTPLAYLDDGDRLLVFASNAGAPDDPAWYRNIRADPRVTVEVGTETFAGAALPVEGEERDRLYARQAERVPVYAEYQRKAGRVIPVVALYRASAPGRAWAIGDELVKIHNDLRGRLAGLRDEVLAALDGRAPAAALSDLGAQLREHCVSVCDVLGEHHDNEEGRAFPRLEAEFPGLAPVVERLRREHVQVTEARRDLQALVDDLDAADPAHVRAELDRMTAGLDAHFAYEEEQLRAVLNAVGPSWAPPRLARSAGPA